MRKNIDVEVRLVQDRVVVLLGPLDHLELDLFHAEKLRHDLDEAVRTLTRVR